MNFNKRFVRTISVLVIMSSIGVTSVLGNTPHKTFHSMDLEKVISEGLVNYNQEIDISLYGGNPKFVDILQRARIQNPMIPTVKNMKYNNKVIVTEFMDTEKEAKSKQDKISNKVNEIVNKVIKSEMNELEKQQALYDYLENNSTYDFEVETYMNKNKITSIPYQYRDSFTPYGVLINGKGLCGSYAEAYKLLLDKVGIESIIVTGKLKDGTPHAWNKVHIKDKWYNVDVTNNHKATGVNKMLYNVSDKVAEDLGYIVDDRYWTDYDIHIFNAEDNSRDVYLNSGKYIEDIKQLEQKIKEISKLGPGKVTLRVTSKISPEVVKGESKKLASKYLKSYSLSYSNNFLVINKL